MKGILTLLVVLTTAAAVSAQNSVQQYISKKDALVVMNMSPYTTYQKLNKETREEYKASETIARMLMQMAGKEATEKELKAMKAKLEDSKKIGVETQKDVYMWVQRPANPRDELYENDPEAMFVNVILPVLDGGKFRSFLDDLFGMERTKKMIPAGDAMNMINNSMLINWNKNRLVMSFTTSDQSFFEEYDEYQERVRKMLFQHANDLGKVTKETSLAQDTDMQNYVKNDADFSVWMDYGNFMNLSMADMPAQAMETFESLMDIFGDMKIGANGYFNNGEAKISTTTFSGEKMGEIMRKSYTTSINKNFFKYINNTNLMGLYSMSMNFEAFMRDYGNVIYDALDNTKEGKLVNNMIDIVDIFIDEDEIYQLFKGDMLVALTDIRIVEQKSYKYEYNEKTDDWEEVPTTRKEMMPIVSMMLSHGNKANIMKFIELGANAGVLSKRAEGVWGIGGSKEEIGTEVFVMVKDDMILISNDEDLANNANGFPKNKQLDGKTIKAMADYVQYGFMDAKKVLDNLRSAGEKMENPMPKQLDEVGQLFSRMELYTLRPEGNILKSEMRMVMKDKNTNILQTMVDGMMQMRGSKSGSSEEDGKRL